MPSYSTPFAGRGYDVTPSLRIADFIRQSGANRAEATRRGGELLGAGIANVGQQVGAGLGQYAQQRAEADKQAQLTRRDQAFIGLFEMFPDGAIPAKELVSIYGPKDGLTLAAGLEEFRKLQAGQVEDPRKLAVSVGAAFKATKSPELQRMLWPQVQQAAVKARIVGPDDLPAEYQPEIADALIAWGSGQVPEAPTPPELIQRDPTRDLVNPVTGEVVSAGTPAPKDEPNPTEASLALRAAQGDPQARRALDLIRQQRVTAGSGNGDPGPLETIIGPDGKPIRVPRKDAVGKSPAAGTLKPASGLEKRALNFFNRAQQADAELESLEPQIQELGLAGQLRQEWAPNFAQSQLGQSYLAAQRAFTEARLRKDSGAAIPEQEFANDRQTYFAQPGDSKETLEQKRRARAAILASLGFESGQALGEYVGDADEARRLVESYKARATKPGSKQTIGRFEIEIEP